MEQDHELVVNISMMPFSKTPEIQRPIRNPLFDPVALSEQSAPELSLGVDVGEGLSHGSELVSEPGLATDVEVLELTAGESQVSEVEAEPIDPHSGAEVEVELHDDLLNTELSRVPDKMAFKIGEVADLLELKQYVLRYWESEFDQLKPKKSAHNQRMYSRKDVETALMIKKLLYRDRFSIEGARKALRSLKKKIKVERDWESVVQRQFTAKERVQAMLEEIQRIKSEFDGPLVGA